MLHYDDFKPEEFEPIRDKVEFQIKELYLSEHKQFGIMDWVTARAEKLLGTNDLIVDVGFDGEWRTLKFTKIYDAFR